MKKVIGFFLAAFLFSVVTACAMGPIYTGAKTAIWDAPISGTPTGYYLYWRTTGTTDWPTSQRVVTSAMTLDLIAAGLPQGLWQITVTAFDSESESGPSNLVTWVYVIIGGPANLRTVR